MIEVLSLNYVSGYKRNCTFITDSLNLENITVFEVSKDKDSFSESLITRKTLLDIFVYDYIICSFRNIVIFYNVKLELLGVLICTGSPNYTRLRKTPSVTIFQKAEALLNFLAVHDLYYSLVNT